MNPPLPSFVDASALTIGDVTGAGDAVIRVGAAAVAAGAIEYFLSRPFVPRLFAY
jgi:bifunctional ADP-heptose synthase (sugar kinase/adenylyltransferase)